MFGVSVSESYLLNKLLINIEDSRSMCDYKKKYTCVHRNCGVRPGYNIQASMLHTGWSSTRCTEVMEMAWADDSTLGISNALL